MKKSITLKYSDFPQPEERDLRSELLNMINMGLRLNPALTARKMNYPPRTTTYTLKQMADSGIIKSRLTNIKIDNGKYHKGLIYEKIDSNNRNKPPRTKRN